MKRMRVKDHGARRRWGMFVSRESHATKFLGKAKTFGGSWMGGKSDVAQIAVAILKLKFGSLGCQSQIWHEQWQLHWSSCYGCNATWPEIRNLLRRETESAVSGLSGVLSGFEMDEQTRGKMLADLEDYARGVKAREEAGRVLMGMKDRFATLFSRDSDSMPRLWTRKSLKLLSVMAAIRLDDDADNIENTLSAALVESGSNTVTSTSTMSVDPLASSTWEEVPSSKTLITPVRCKSLWRQFKTQTGYTAAQAIAAQADEREIKTVRPDYDVHFAICIGFSLLSQYVLGCSRTEHEVHVYQKSR